MSPSDLKRFLARPGYAVAGGSRSPDDRPIGIAPTDAPKKKRARTPTGPATVDPLVAAFFQQNGIPPATPEFRFSPPRRWRFDYCWPAHKIALEVEGGIFTQGRHTRGAGYLSDMAKYSEAAIVGWRVIRVTPKDLISSNTANMLRRLMP